MSNHLSEKERYVKKSPGFKEEKKKPRRLILNRETIQRLEDVDLLAAAGRAGELPTTTWPDGFCAC
jgi:hypothetical protein